MTIQKLISFCFLQHPSIDIIKNISNIKTFLTIVITDSFLMPNMVLIVKCNSFWFIPLQMTDLALENNIYVQNVDFM